MTAAQQIEVARMAHAVAIGEVADRVFARACLQHEIDPADALSAPLLFVGLAAMPAEGGEQ